MRPSTVVVVPYDPAWPATFERIRSTLAPALDGIAVAIEHVGSTSVPGLAAKPVIDVDVIVPAEDDVPEAVRRLATLGYAHLGDLGIEGREAFDEPPGGVRHNLYVCWQGSLGLANHLALRDHLRAHADVARDYGALKLELAARHADDIDAYIEAKTAFIVEVLRREQLSDAQRDAIARANRRPPPA